MRWWSTDGEPATIDKPALRAAVDAADAWVDSNAASFNSALPVAARTRLSARQKAKVLLAVIERRFGVS
jgi:hypothetical protein